MCTSLAATDPNAAYAEAVTLHQSGQLQKAEQLYRGIVKADPKHADALHMLGALLVALHGPCKYDEARSLVQQAINCKPKEAKYRHSLGVIHQRCGNKAEAALAFERASEKDPMNITIMMNHAKALKDLGRHMRAAEVYKSLTMLQPDHPSAHYRRASCLRIVGWHEQALAAFRSHLRLFPEDHSTRFWIAALSGDASSMAAMPPDLVAGLFDQYSDNFDDHLCNKLGYRTPQLLMDALLEAAPATPTRAKWRRCVDLGCGTGLMGPLLRPHVTGALEGVDLSSGMVAQADKRGCYDVLEVGELVAFLEGVVARLGNSAVAGGQQQGSNEPYDCLVAADVFVYIGRLDPVLTTAAKCSNPGSLFAFSVEALEAHLPGFSGSDGASSSTNTTQAGAAEGGQQGQEQLPGAAAGFSLTRTGRYVHSRAYLSEVAASTGWRVVSVRAEVLRFNGGKPVHGHLCVMVKGS